MFLKAWRRAQQEAAYEEDCLDASGWPLKKMGPFQIRVPDRDIRRDRNRLVRRTIGVPHWIYLLKTDLEAPTQPVAHGLPSAPTKAIRPRTSPEQERGKMAMMEIYGKIPPQTEVANKVLDQAVNKHLKQKGLERKGGRAPTGSRPPQITHLPRAVFAACITNSRDVLPCDVKSSWRRWCHPSTIS